MRLKNKVAVVTGGGGGLGEEICRKFAEEGAKVAVFDLNGDAAKKVVDRMTGEGFHSIALTCDVSDKKSVDRAAIQVIDALGTIDIWVNCAGISKILPFLSHNEDIWDKTMDINLKGSFLGCQAAVREMLPKKSGVIINLSSQSGKTGNSHYQAYCASKFGVIGLTQSLAVEFAKDGIRVNAICPGVVFTGMWDEQITDYANKRNMKPEDVLPYFESKIPMGKIGKVEDIANAALFLASDDSSYITGQALNVSGGSIMF